MDYLSFSEYFKLYQDWKANLLVALTSYRASALKNQPKDGLVQSEIDSILHHLSSEQLVIACCGDDILETSNVISKLFYPKCDGGLLFRDLSHLGVRNLVINYQPSQKPQAQLKLLPIESTASDLSLTQWRERCDKWTVIDFGHRSASSIINVCRHLSQTKCVTYSEALAFGLADSLSPRKTGKVEVPAWRYAELHITDPSIAYGVSFICLGGQAGVPQDDKVMADVLANGDCAILSLTKAAFTPSNLRLFWQRWENKTPYPVFFGQLALSEKKLLLPSGIVGENTELNQNTSLGLDAKMDQAKTFVIDHEEERLASQLARALIQAKMRALTSSAFRRFLPLLGQHKTMVKRRWEQLNSQKGELETLVVNSHAHLKLLINECERAKAEQKRLSETVGPSAQILKKQKDILLASISSETVQKFVADLRRQMITSKSTRGLMYGMRVFKKCVYANFIEFGHEVTLAHKLSNSMYTKLLAVQGSEKSMPKRLLLNEFNQRLRKVFQDAERWHRHFVITFSEHSVVVKRYFAKTVKAIMRWYRDLRQACLAWYQAVINPLTQQLHQHKIYTSRRISDLTEMQASGSAIQGRLRGISLLMLELEALIDAGVVLNGRLLPLRHEMNFDDVDTADEAGFGVVKALTS